MAFDRTNQADLDALWVEVSTDPLGIGYNQQSTNLLLRQLNDEANNPDVSPAAFDARKFDTAAILDAMDADVGELEAQQTNAGALAYTRLLFHFETFGEHNTIEPLAPYKTNWRALWPNNGAIQTALDGQTVHLSRVEVLFGRLTVVSSADWIAARDNHT